MNLRNYYQQDAWRYLEIVCGICLSAFSLLIGVGAVLVAARGYRSPGAVVIAGALALVALGLIRIGLKLLRGQSRVGRPLLSSAAMIGGAAIFFLGGLLLIYIGITQRDIRGVLGGVGILPASYFGWRFARERRRSSMLPNSSLDRSRDP